ncbi:MAG: hypothetical protein GY854_28740 [Deltaproteobacteria bacterium]|nr:hypothetical protein [Deltaproteobacteria bacterium]
MNHHDSGDGQPKDLFERRGVRWTLFVVIPAVIFVLVCAGIRVSEYGINHTIIVFGQKKLVADWPAALRITLMADDGGFFLPTRLTGHITRGQERHLLFDGTTKDRGYALAHNFRVPKLSPGPAELELDIRFDEKRRIVRAQVEILKKPPPEKLTVPDDSATLAEMYEVEKDGITVQALTEDRGAPTGLTSVIFIRARDEKGAPASANFELEVSGESKDTDPKREILTDRLGLSAISAKPLELALPMKVTGSHPKMKEKKKEADKKDAGIKIEQQDGYLFPKVVYGGITAALHNPVVEKDDPLRISAQQISAGGPIYIDLFFEGRWVQAMSSWFGGRTANLEIRPVRTGLGRVQITNSVFGPGGTIAVRHFYVLDKNKDLNDGIRSILSRLKASSIDREWARAVNAMPLERGTGFDRRLVGAFALSRLYAGHQPLPQLIASRQEDDTELREFKARFQRMVMLAILLVGFGVASLIVMVAVHAHRHQQRMTDMIMSESGADDDSQHQWQTDMGARTSKRRVLFQGVVLFFIIAAAFASIALLIDTLTWRQ